MDTPLIPLLMKIENTQRETMPNRAGTVSKLGLSATVYEVDRRFVRSG